MLLTDLPNELLATIMENFAIDFADPDRKAHLKSLHSLVLVCRKINVLAIPLLYRKIASSEMDIERLSTTFTRNPRPAQHIRELLILLDGGADDAFAQSHLPPVQSGPQIAWRRWAALTNVLDHTPKLKQLMVRSSDIHFTWNLLFPSASQMAEQSHSLPRLERLLVTKDSASTDIQMEPAILSYCNPIQLVLRCRSYEFEPSRDDFQSLSRAIHSTKSIQELSLCHSSAFFEALELSNLTVALPRLRKLKVCFSAGHLMDEFEDATRKLATGYAERLTELRLHSSRFPHDRSSRGLAGSQITRQTSLRNFSGLEKLHLEVHSLADWNAAVRYDVLNGWKTKLLRHPVVVLPQSIIELKVYDIDGRFARFLKTLVQESHSYFPQLRSVIVVHHMISSESTVMQETALFRNLNIIYEKRSISCKFAFTQEASHAHWLGACCAPDDEFTRSVQSDYQQ